MTPQTIDEAARALFAARANRVRIRNVPDDCQASSIDDAYQIQDRLIDLIGQQVYGWKIGATSQKARDFVGIKDASLRARLLADNCFEHPADLRDHFFFMRAVECEFAFTLGVDLPAGEAPYDQETVVASVDSMHPAIEISDSRYLDWTSVGGPALVADNCNDGAFVRGAKVEQWRNTDLNSHAVTLFVNDEHVASGSGGEVITGPLGVLVWLANELAVRGMGLHAGQVVTTGSCTGVVVAQPGDRIRADFGKFGKVELCF